VAADLNIEQTLKTADSLLREGRHEEAGPILRDALSRDPNNGAALWSLAYAYMKGEKWGVAYNLLKRAIELEPGEHKLWCNLAAAALSMASIANDDKLLDEAEQLLHKSIRKAGETTNALNHLALISVNRGQPARAQEFAQKSLKLDPEQADVLETLGYAQLAQGNWKEGFANYDCAINNSKMRMLEPFDKEPHWDGTDGVRLFVRGEQGIGDEISYASAILDAVKHGNTVTYECDKRLEGLMKRSFPDVTVHGTRFGKRAWSGEFDAHCLSGSLCREYRQKPEDFPRKGFLVPDPQRQIQWRALLDTLPGRKVGISWAGGLPNTFSGRRSFNLRGLEPLLKTPGITWVSLQYRDAEAEIAAMQERGINIHHWERAVGKGVDYDETAALVSELDCVVSVCTAVVHLSGALGKKCLVLAPSKPRWWYGMSGRDHAWYESLEIYRQTDKWPVERVTERLKDYLQLKQAVAA
jgi:tetratricopeptide (TPR) repeat protein